MHFFKIMTCSQMVPNDLDTSKFKIHYLHCAHTPEEQFFIHFVMRSNISEVT